jgi:sodium bicarbonate transporter 10
MIGVRKSLDFVFTRRELKVLDDVMPEHRRKEIVELRKEGEEKDEKDTLNPTQGLVASGSSGNVAIPLANGNILKIPVDKFSSESSTEQQQQINISEQLTKSSAWKTIEQKNCIPKNQNQPQPSNPVMTVTAPS